MSLPVKGIVALAIIIMVLMVKSSFQGRVIMAVGLVGLILYARSSNRRR